MTKFDFSSSQLTRTLALMALFVASCLPQRPGSDLSISSGQYIEANFRNQADALVKVMAMAPRAQGGYSCSSTIVSTNTIITAAHCVNTFAYNRPTETRQNLSVCISSSGPYKGLCAKTVYTPSDYIPLENTSTDASAFDVSILVFEGAPFQHYLPVSLPENTIMVGQPVVIGGFSSEDGEQGRKEHKRWGHNTISDILTDELDSIQLLYGGNFETAITKPGDSGGTMLRQCELIGVVSRGTPSNYQGPKQTEFVNLLQPKINAWLSSIEAKGGGANICTTSEVGTANCPTDYAMMPVGTDVKEENGAPSFPCARPGEGGGGGKDVLFVRKDVVDPAKDVVYYATSSQGDKIGYCKNVEAADCKPETFTALVPREPQSFKKRFRIESPLFLREAQDNDTTFYTFVSYKDGKLLSHISVFFKPKP